jgi:hypothetical protein
MSSLLQIRVIKQRAVKLSSSSSSVQKTVEKNPASGKTTTRNFDVTQRDRERNHKEKLTTTTTTTRVSDCSKHFQRPAAAAAASAYVICLLWRWRLHGSRVLNIIILLLMLLLGFLSHPLGNRSRLCFVFCTTFGLLLVR